LNSGNQEIDKLIKNVKSNKDNNALEWINYDNFEDIEYLAEGGFGKVYKAK